MARSKKYTKKLLTLDLILLFLSFGLWMFVMLPRELYRHQ